MTDADKDRIQSLLDSTGISYYRFMTAFKSSVKRHTKQQSDHLFVRILSDLIELQDLLKHD